MASSVGQVISSNLVCPICVQLYDDPKLLLCEHTFCKKCLIAILDISLQTSKRSLTCPICRNRTVIEEGNIGNLNTNHNIMSLIDDVRNRQQRCHMCDTRCVATYFCYECDTFMCNECLEKHNVWPPHLKHRIVSVEEIKQGKVIIVKKVYCEHPPEIGQRQLCTDICISCKKFICTRCWLVKHKDKDHNVTSIEEYKISIQMKIESLQDQGNKKAIAANAHMALIENQRMRVNEHFDDKKAKIKKIRQESNDKINKRWETLDNQLESQRNKLCLKLDNMKYADEKSVLLIQTASELAGNSLKAPLEDDTIVIRDSLSDKLKNVLAREDPHDQPAEDVADRAEQLIFTQNSKHDQLGLGEFRFLSCKLERNVEFSKKDDMNVMAATLDGRMAIGYDSGGIDIYSAEGQLQDQVLIDVPIRKVAFLSDGRYVVCQRGVENTINLYTQGQEKLSVCFTTLDQDEGGDPDLTVDSNDLIYISYMKAKKIQKFLPEGGEATREIPCVGYEPVRITSHNDLLIVTCGKKKIRMVDQDGHVMKRMLQNSGFHPHAAVTQNNSVLVAWVKDDAMMVSIDEYTDKLSHIRNVVSDQTIEKPTRCLYYLKVFPSGEIAFCTPDRLYIFN